MTLRREVNERVSERERERKRIEKTRLNAIKESLQHTLNHVLLRFKSGTRESITGNQCKCELEFFFRLSSLFKTLIIVKVVLPPFI